MLNLDFDLPFRTSYVHLDSLEDVLKVLLVDGLKFIFYKIEIEIEIEIDIHY